jgi:hypothetical protein
MKNKHKSLLSVIAIACAVGVPLSLTTAHELPVEASLSAPGNYHINYAYDISDQVYYLGTTAPGSDVLASAIPSYTRTADGIYYNYRTILDSTNSNSALPTGLEITMDHNYSNTTWVKQPDPSTLYYPTSSSIGSDNTVGSLRKLRYTFDNQTNKDYYLIFDISSTGTSYAFEYTINGRRIGRAPTTDGWILLHDAFGLHYIPAYSTIIIDSTDSSGALYFDAWYMRDIGINPAYEVGYDLGEIDGIELGYEDGFTDGLAVDYETGYADGLGNNPNVLINAFESLIGMIVNFTFILFTLEMFGVSILSIVGVLFGLLTIVWILKTIRG